MTCEIEKDRQWIGQYECATHGVWYMDSDKKPKELCPVGEAEAEAEAEAERLRAHTWQQERAAIIRFIDTKLNTMTTIDKIHVGDALKLLIKVIDAGEHWPGDRPW